MSRESVTVVVFNTVTGGSSDNHGWEAVAVDWFRPDNLSNRMVGFAREYIVDSLKKPLVPVEKTQLIPHWKAWLFQFAFALRGLRNKILGRP